MELHITSRKWRRLSGSGWLRKDQTGIFFMYGIADRHAAMIQKQQHGGLYSYAYADLWTRDRMHGHVPSPRGETACIYNTRGLTKYHQNAVLDKIILFGGYSPTVPTWFEDINDTTFIGDMNSVSSTCAPVSRKQVLMRGFPTYRAESIFLTDAKTGKIFLFGGYKNTISRRFVDLWQLRLDVPGEFFQGVYLEEEARTATAGPWQRCFSCECCNGRGWKEYKETHACGKS
ncbi:hypothetical protein B0H19DRAFT_1209820 [Mycena capillaripes]|nr:hypothetical protein B0H19DRAFT_1209820 [Mycena capillaripes]